MFGSEAGKWRAVAETVQGDQSPSSCVVRDGRIIFSARPVPKSAKPNLKLLSEILRSDEPLPKVAREWLANLFDPDSTSDYHVETLVRRPQGAKPAGITHNWDAARYAHELMRWGEDIRKHVGGDGSVEVKLWGKNIFNEDYRTVAVGSFASYGAETVAEFGDPRTYGVSLIGKF